MSKVSSVWAKRGCGNLQVRSRHTRMRCGPFWCHRPAERESRENLQLTHSLSLSQAFFCPHHSARRRRRHRKQGKSNKPPQLDFLVLLHLCCFFIYSRLCALPLQTERSSGFDPLYSAWPTCSSNPAWAVIPTNRTHLLPLSARGWSEGKCRGKFAEWNLRVNNRLLMLEIEIFPNCAQVCVKLCPEFVQDSQTFEIMKLPVFQTLKTTKLNLIFIFKFSDALFYRKLLLNSVLKIFLH